MSTLRASFASSGFLDGRFWRGVWRVADPKITLASAASMLLGTALAAAAGPLSIPWLLVVVAGIFSIEAAKNASGEIFDWDSGADQGVAAAFYALGGAAGLAVVLFREPLVLALGVAGVALAYFYHAPTFKLSYR